MPTPVSDERTPSRIRDVLRADLRASRGRQRLALVLVIVWLVYEWGPGNESVTPWVIARSIESDSTLAVLWVAPLIGATFTFVQQLASGTTALIGFSLFDRSAHAVWNRLPHDRRPNGWQSMGWPTRVGFAFLLGTTAVALVEVVRMHHSTRRARWFAVVQSAALCATVVAGLAIVASGLISVGRRIPALASATDVVLGVLASPLLWLGLGLVTGWAWYRSLGDDVDPVTVDGRPE